MEVNVWLEGVRVLVTERQQEPQHLNEIPNGIGATAIGSIRSR